MLNFVLFSPRIFKFHLRFVCILLRCLFSQFKRWDCFIRPLTLLDLGMKNCKKLVIPRQGQGPWSCIYKTKNFSIYAWMVVWTHLKKLFYWRRWCRRILGVQYSKISKCLKKAPPRYCWWLKILDTRSWGCKIRCAGFCVRIQGFLPKSDGVIQKLKDVQLTLPSFRMFIIQFGCPICLRNIRPKYEYFEQNTQKSGAKGTEKEPI